MRIFANSLKFIVPLMIVLFAGINAFPEDVEIGVQMGQKAPDFELPQLNGERVTLNEVVAQNDVTLLFFFLAAS